jgi:hypothetical protein
MYKVSLSPISPLLQSAVSPIYLKAVKHQNVISEVKKMEHCKNPLKDECRSENIKLYIQKNGENLPICQQCWIKIADQEW